jgi:hypothetical protein
MIYGNYPIIGKTLEEIYENNKLGRINFSKTTYKGENISSNLLDLVK